MSVFLKGKTVLCKVGESASVLLKWTLFSVIVGILCGIAGVLFHFSVDEATHLRESYPFIIFFLPVAGIVIVFLYQICNMTNDKGTNTMFLAVREKAKISPFLAPLILITTALTHLCGGSSGREGAALQIGGGVASYVAKLFRLDENNTSVLVMCGMSALFSAVFGTPLTATVFTLEVVCVGIMHYSILLPALLSSLVSFSVAQLFGVEKSFFNLGYIPQFNGNDFISVILLAICTGLLSIVFILLMHNASKILSKYVENRYLRIVAGGCVIILLTLLVGTYDYNGAGMGIITRAVENGVASPASFILKILFTVITLSSGFKGGEIVPSFFIGSTFGVAIAPFVGLDPSFAAAIGLVSFFCGVVNCPVASILLSVELFGSEGLLYFALAVAVSYVISGNHSLYSSQRIVYSKLQSSFVNEASENTHGGAIN